MLGRKQTILKGKGIKMRLSKVELYLLGIFVDVKSTN